MGEGVTMDGWKLVMTKLLFLERDIVLFSFFRLK